MRTLLKDAIREIRNSFGRFISILLIIALGVGFFSGIKATAPDMKHTGDLHFDKYNLMDLWLVSTMGFDDKDLEAFRGLDSIDKVTAGYSMDGLIKIDDKDMVVKLMSLPKGYKNSLNKPILVDGRLPEHPGECVLEASDANRKRFKLGSRIELESGGEDPLTDQVEHGVFTVVGFANSPLHITFERGTSPIGNGKVHTFMIVGEDEFKSDYYTDVYLGIGKDLDSFSEDYKTRLDQVKAEVEDLGEERRRARLDEIKDELEKKLVDGREELEKEKKKGESDLAAAKLKLDQGTKDLDQGRGELKKAKNKLDQAIKSGKAGLSAGEKNLRKSGQEYDKALESFRKAKPALEKKLDEGQALLEEGEAGLEDLDKARTDLGQKLKDLEGLEELDEEELSLVRAQLEEVEVKYQASLLEVEKARRQLEVAREELSQGERDLARGKTQLDGARKELDQGRQALEDEEKDGRSRLAQEEAKLREAEASLEDGKLDYEEGLAKFNSGINKGERDLRKLDREIGKLEKPDWYVIKRSDTRDYIEFEMGADRIDSVARVFPLFFLLIALLVCLTTMTRMVDEQRGYIGTLKALGYRNRDIMLKYLIYGFIASVLGSVLGLLVGFKVFPTVIFNAYRLMFIMPPVVTGFNLYFASLSTLAAILTTSLAVFLAVRKELKETPALLMRPKAPKVGKRIFLEKIDFIWSRMSFSRKVTARNIFRYKRRLFMTILGIAGCTALLVAGFGLKDSIMDITVNQFDHISDYEMSIDVNDGIVDRKADPVIKFLEGDERVESFILAYEKPIEVEGPDGFKDLDLIVVPDDKNLNDYIKLRKRLTKEEILMDSESLVLTEKMGEMLGLGPGDDLLLLIDGREHRLRVKDLTENYAFHYAYMTESLYKNMMGEDIEYNKILAKNRGVDKDFEDGLSEDLLGVEDVSSVLFITGLSKSLNDTMDSLNSVVIVIILAAGALAFIVLYNLTNINVSERMREIATIKVLGFYDREVSSYVYRENNILTLLGMVVGLGLGLILHQFIILTVEIDMIMFGRQVRPISLIYSGLLTLVFSLLVNGAMHFRLKRIDMVESMKSVD